MADFGVQRPHFYHTSSMHKAIQIVALQKKERSNPFNTKGTKCNTKDTKNFLENKEERHAAKW
jgi:hypothetical protein